MSEKTIVLVLNTNCHFCTESAPFYKQLTRAALEKHVPVLALFPQSDVEGRAYLKKLSVEVTDVKQAQLTDVFVTGTPTVMIVDHDGIVRSGWVGKLTDDGERSIIAAL